MAKYYGNIGYVETVETEPGLYEEQIKELPYYGDTIRDTRMLQSSLGINDNINISTQISIVADPYAYEHIYAMRYAVYQGAKWKVTSADPSQRPRIILTLGGLYNGESNSTTE